MIKTTKTMKLTDVVKLNIAESEVDLGRSWNLIQKLNFLTPVIGMGFTEGTYILVVNDVVVDGRQSIIALREYLENKLGTDNSNLPTYNSLDALAKEYVHNLEFEILEASIDMDKGEMFKSLNVKLEKKGDVNE